VQLSTAVTKKKCSQKNSHYKSALEHPRSRSTEKNMHACVLYCPLVAT